MSSTPPTRFGIEPPRLSSGQIWLYLVFLMALVLGQQLYVAEYMLPPPEPFFPSTEVIYRV